MKEYQLSVLMTCRLLQNGDIIDMYDESILFDGCKNTKGKKLYIKGRQLKYDTILMNGFFGLSIKKIKRHYLHRIDGDIKNNNLGNLKLKTRERKPNLVERVFVPFDIEDFEYLMTTDFFEREEFIRSTDDGLATTKLRSGARCTKLLRWLLRNEMLEHDYQDYIKYMLEREI